MHDELFMRRCIELAESGLGAVAPNPMTGCVIVHDAKVVGEGFHREFGQSHAEVNAIDDTIRRYGKDMLRYSTLYVSLEPCVHHGKTPPCTERIIAERIPKVVVGCVDSFEKVNGRGLEMLRANGVDITEGVLEQECRQLNRRFFTFHEKKRPYIVLKYAQTRDGFLTHPERRWISNAFSQRLVHKWRSSEQAIMVGTNTAVTDNPALTVRLWKGKNPLRVVVGSRTMPKELNINNSEAYTYVYGTVKEALKELHPKNVLSVLVEGGGSLLQSLMDENLWDEARIITGNVYAGEGVKAPVLNKSSIHPQMEMDEDEVFVVNNDCHKFTG